MKIVLDQNWVRVIDGVLSPEYCEHLIDKFEQCSRWHRRRANYAHLWELDCFNLRHRPMTVIEKMTRSTESVWDWTQDCETVASKIYPMAGQYREHWDRLHSFPEDYSMEGIRIKAYRANMGDQFPIHTDAGNRDACTRFLRFLFYLNDNDAGTELPLEHVTVDARQGRLVIFPPGLQWPHVGQEPRSLDKYILSTYLHFI